CWTRPRRRSGSAQCFLSESTVPCPTRPCRCGRCGPARFRLTHKRRGTFKCGAVKAPGYGDRRKAMLEDIARLTGGKAMFEDLGIELESVKLGELGPTRKVKADKDNTNVIEGGRQEGGDLGAHRPDAA